jgi:DNA polymerase-1
LPGVHGVGEKTARALVQVYPSLDELLDDAEAAQPRPGPLKGKPALRARVRDARPYVEAMQRLVPINPDPPLSVWSGERDDIALRARSEELSLKGPVQRLLAALESVGAS